MSDERKDKVRELHALGRQDPDVKLMIDAVCAREGTNIVALPSDKPEVFDMLYEACFDMVDQLGTAGELGL